VAAGSPQEIALQHLREIAPGTEVRLRPDHYLGALAACTAISGLALVATVATTVGLVFWWLVATYCTVANALPLFSAGMHSRKNERGESQGVIRHRRPHVRLPHDGLSHA